MVGGINSHTFASGRENGPGLEEWGEPDPTNLLSFSPRAQVPFSKYASGTQLGSSDPKPGGGGGGSSRSSISRGGGGGRSRGMGSSGAGKEAERLQV